MALLLPQIINCLWYFSSCATNSLSKLKGELVTTISDCLSDSTHSSLLKSPSLLSAILLLCGEKKKRH